MINALYFYLCGKFGFCGRCKLPFNAWFIWGGYRYCWPCYKENSVVIKENGEVKEKEGGK